MNALALIAHVPGQSVPERNFMRDRCATVAAIVHENVHRGVLIANSDTYCS
jgi:hypothetical protein